MTREFDLFFPLDTNQNDEVDGFIMDPGCDNGDPVWELATRTELLTCVASLEIALRPLRTEQQVLP